MSGEYCNFDLTNFPSASFPLPAHYNISFHRSPSKAAGSTESLVMQLRLIYSYTLSLSVAGAIVAADHQQQPLRQQEPNALAAWLDKLRSYLPSTENAKASVDQAVDSARAKAASVNLSPLTLDGWRATLHPSSTAATGPGEPEEWWVLVTGGNRTCLGGREDCVTVEKAFNVMRSSLIPSHRIYDTMRYDLAFVLMLG